MSLANCLRSVDVRLVGYTIPALLYFIYLLLYVIYLLYLCCPTAGICQAWSYIEAPEAIAPNTIGLGATSKVSLRHKDFPMEGPFAT